MTLTQLAQKHNLEPESLSFVSTKLLTEKGYAPYCGSDRCFCRAPFNGNQWKCPRCGWQSEQPANFIAAYKERWNLGIARPTDLGD